MVLYHIFIINQDNETSGFGLSIIQPNNLIELSIEIFINELQSHFQKFEWTNNQLNQQIVLCEQLKGNLKNYFD